METSWLAEGDYSKEAGGGGRSRSRRQEQEAGAAPIHAVKHTPAPADCSCRLLLPTAPPSCSCASCGIIASVTTCRKMRAADVRDAFEMLSKFLSGDEHYLASSKAYGDLGMR